MVLIGLFVCVCRWDGTLKDQEKRYKQLEGYYAHMDAYTGTRYW